MDPGRFPEVPGGPRRGPPALVDDGPTAHTAGMGPTIRGHRSRFADRRAAGRQLAARLVEYAGEHPVVLGLPRGGVPVAFEVAAALGAPLDVIVVRKLGVPSQPELGMGAVGEEGARVLNDDVIRIVEVTPAELATVEARERAEVTRRADRFRGGHDPIALRDRVVILVDDGVATGGTMRAAVEVARHRGARRVVVAVPVGAPDSLADIRRLADEVVALLEPADLWAVGAWYEDFTATEDDEVVRLVRLSRDPPVGGGTATEVMVPTAGVVLPGTLGRPDAPRGVVVFAHGSGSSRASPRNRSVARALQESGWATLLFDLLSADEAHDRDNVFDVALLAARLAGVTAWVRDRDELRGLPIATFGASTGAAAALWASTERGGAVEAIVARGGRPDLAAERLPAVTAPTMFIVGGDDELVLRLNREAAALLVVPHELVVVPGASHLFEEPGTLDAVVTHARRWFMTYARAARS
jgi:putative phosphoribosyl transferase